jgi:hypothetical protein
MERTQRLMYVIEFRDGGPVEWGELHRGWAMDCERVRAGVSAISYSGDRAVRCAYTFLCPLDEKSSR